MVDVSKIDMYERGELDGPGMLALFAELIKTGEAWQLQGHYGRTCDRLIKEGWITSEGEIITANDFGAEDDEEPDCEPSAEQERAWDEQYDGTSLGR